MCLIALAWRAHPRYALVLAANRDEFHDRPSAALSEWPDAPGLFGGRDLRAGGSWLALSAQGRLAAVTNVRELERGSGLRSRGALVTQFLRSEAGSADAAEGLMAEATRYGAFNLLLFDGRDLSYASNRPQPGWQPVLPGVHGLSNAALDTPWPKTLRLKAAMAGWVESGEDRTETLFAALADADPPPDTDLPDTGVGLARERLLGSPFIRGPVYGTRASSVVRIRHDGRWQFEERRFGPDGRAEGLVQLDGRFSG